MAYYFSELRLGLNIIYENATPAMLVDGTAETPYQYRVLLPWLVRGFLALGVRETAVPLLFSILEFLSTLALVVAFRSYLSLFFNHLLLRSVLAFSIFLVLPFNILHTYWYPYDIPSILFFVLGLAALYRKQWLWYYILFILGTINRETTLFLTIVFIVTCLGQLKWKRLAGHVVIQGFIWLLIKALIQSIYTGNPGQGAFQLTLLDNLQFLLQPGALLWVLPSWGLTWILALIGYRHLKDPFVKRALWVIVPFFAVMMLVGKVDELRIYAELTPIVLSAALLSLQNLFHQEHLLSR